VNAPGPEGPPTPESAATPTTFGSRPIHFFGRCFGAREFVRSNEGGRNLRLSLATTTPAVYCCRKLCARSRASGAYRVIDLTASRRGAAVAHDVSRRPGGRGHVLGAQIVIVSTPVYRATLPARSRCSSISCRRTPSPGKRRWRSRPANPALLAIDHGLRPLLASLGAVTVPTGVYGTTSSSRAGRSMPPAGAADAPWRSVQLAGHRVSGAAPGRATTRPHRPGQHQSSACPS